MVISGLLASGWPSKIREISMEARPLAAVSSLFTPFRPKNFPPTVQPGEVGAANCLQLKSSGPCDSRMHDARKPCQEKIMLYYALVFLVIAIIAGIFGFAGIAGTSAWIAHVLFVIFLVLFIVSLIFRGRPSV